MELSHASDESKVLVIYTGGTIGMLVGHQGYVPEPYFLTETLRTQARFHDPLEDSLFSHSSSVEGYRQYHKRSSSGTHTPDPDVAEFLRTATLPVRSSRPIGGVTATSLSPSGHTEGHMRPPECRMVEEGVYEAQVPVLITPKTMVAGGKMKRIRYAVLEWDPLLDSSNIDNDDWIRMATEIELNYNLFDAFVILHGTDTMAYTSSALSFLLEDLGKTVIVTGAQIPLSQLRNDAVDNFLGALSIAGQYIIPECCLFFNHTLFRGNRVSKTSSHDFNAFTSSNFPPLVNVGIDIVVNWNDVIRQTSLQRFRAHKDMCQNVATLRLFPGITAATVRAFLTPPVKGVVLESFGAGNAPQSPELMKTLREACDRGVVIVNITQCSKGSVSDAYETGRTLTETGVVPGVDMTLESALTKLSYLLSKPELTTADVRDLIGTPLRGELTRQSKPLVAPLKRSDSGDVSDPTSALDQNIETIQSVLSHLVRLSAPPGTTSRALTPVPSTSSPTIPFSSSGPGNGPPPQIVVASANSAILESSALKPSTSTNSIETTAPWSWTASEATTTEIALFSSLIHLAASSDDTEGLQLCLSSGGQGVVNWVNPASGRSPLHVAAVSGSERCVERLLEKGALVHLRDSLGHTALYYAARQGYEAIVETLVRAGANLGGADIEGGYVALSVRKARLAMDERALRIWEKAGARMVRGPGPGMERQDSLLG